MGAERKTETFYAATPSAQTQNRSNEWYGASIFLIGGYRGSTCLSSLDSFCPKTYRVVPLCSMRSARAYAAVAALKDHLYIFGGGDGSSWYHTGKCSNMIKCFI